MKASLGLNTVEVLALLDDIGPMSTADMARLTGRTQQSIGDSLRRLRSRRMIHIARYERQPDGHRGRCTPVYAVGDVQDAPEPRQIGVSERNKAYRRRHKALISARRYTAQRTALGVWSGLL